MQKKKVVVALGHRALGTTLPKQKEAVRKTAGIIVDLVQEGAELVITHSNAPQVGMIHLAMDELKKAHPEYTATPMSVCSAMSQGYIGYDLQNEIRSELLRRGIYKPVATVLTQVTVDPYDEAFHQPTKVIGRVMNAEEAAEEEQRGNYVTKVEGGYRRIVAAPKPQDIVEIDSISLMLAAGQIVIAAGGGGIPVLEQGTDLRGASAVIEKDLISGLLAEELKADELMILTTVEHAVVDYGTEQCKKLEHITIADAEKYMREGHFEEGTMQPKIEAGVNFLKKGGRRVIITSIDKAKDGFLGRTGTIIEA